MNNLSKIKQYTDSVGSIYGTEDFSVYLYSLVKMFRPNTVVELGTGLGSSMLWMGTALEENDHGQLITVDNGQEWEHLKQAADRMQPYYKEDYKYFILNLITEFNLQRTTFINRSVDQPVAEDIDMFFSDFAHGSADIMSLMANYLPRMNLKSVMMFDSASTLFSSYQTINAIVDSLNRKVIPLTMREMCSDIDGAPRLEHIVKHCKFNVQHIVEHKNRAQNSTACIFIEPEDVFPHPREALRF